MCVMSPLPKTAPASAQATLLRFWLPVATWLLLLFIAQGLLTSLLPVASFPTIPAGLSTSCFPEPPPSTNSQTLIAPGFPLDNRAFLMYHSINVSVLCYIDRMRAQT